MAWLIVGQQVEEFDCHPLLCGEQPPQQVGEHISLLAPADGALMARIVLTR